jgi:hypothetical protein
MSDKHAFMPGGCWDDRVGPEDDVCSRCGDGPNHDAHRNEDGTQVVEDWHCYDERYNVR